MKTLQLGCSLVVLAVTSPVLWSAPTRIPAEDFAKPADITNAKLSPDGKSMGYIYVYRGQVPQLSFLDLATNKAIRGAKESGRYLVTVDFQWVSDERVLAFTADGGLSAVNRDGGAYEAFTSFKRRAIGTGIAQTIYASGRNPQRVLLQSNPATSGKPTRFPNVLAVDTLSGIVREEVRNPGDVRAWAADWNGSVRYGLILDELKARLIYRADVTSPWEDLADLGQRADSFSLVGLAADGQLLYVAQPDETGHTALYPYDLKERRMGEVLFRRKGYDIIAPHANYAGVALSAPIFSPKQRTLLGVNFVDDGPHQYWFDPVMTALQAKIDTLIPGLVNFIVSMDQAENRVLILSWSDRHPGVYSLLDRATGNLKMIGERMPWIKAAQMASMYPIELPARDGLTLHGYLTLPAGAVPKNQPLVVLAHGGPWARDIWGFDPIVQFLANRGYAVLQVNYRGSTGYGQEFSAKGRQEIGGTIQDDITDAVRWAMAKGLVDPQRVAIMGASYGGFSALYALAKQPELYRCGVDVCGVTNWPDLIERQLDDEDKAVRAHWVDQVGDITDAATRARLASASPVNFAREITAPLLIVHGKVDRTVPFRQSTTLVAALEAAGHRPQTLFLSRLGHGWPQGEDGAIFLNQLEEFLAKNLTAR